MNDPENLIKNLNRWDEEFGKSLTLYSNVCAQCFKENPKRKLCALSFDFVLPGEKLIHEGEEFLYVNVPVCYDCEVDKYKLKANLFDYLGLFE